MRPLNHTVISFQTIGACTARLPDRVISGGEYSEGDTPPTVCNRSIFPDLSGEFGRGRWNLLHALRPAFHSRTRLPGARSK